MEDIEKIIETEALTTCDNENCKYIGCLKWCYNGNERNCEIYVEWEKKMIANSTKRTQGLNREIDSKIKFK